MSPVSESLQIKLNKLHLKPKQGSRLGSATATLLKIRAATSGAQAEERLEQNNTAESNSSCSLLSDNARIFLNGNFGEVIVYFYESKLIEVWDWFPPSSQTAADCDTLYIHAQAELKLVDKKLGKPGASGSTEGLDPLNNRSVESITFITGTISTRMEFLVISVEKNKYLFQIHSVTHSFHISVISQTIAVPDYLIAKRAPSDSLKFTVKVSDSHLVIGNNLGCLYVLKRDLNQKRYLDANHDLSLSSVKKSINQSLANEINSNSRVSDEEVVLVTSCFNEAPIFDIIGNWLAYSPTKEEYEHIRTSTFEKELSKERLDPIAISEQDNVVETMSLFTPVKFDKWGPLFQKVLTSVSNSALDGLYKVSELSSNKVRAYLNKPQESEKKENDMIQTMNSLGKAFGSLVYSTVATTASSIQNTTKGSVSSDNKLVRIIDLSSDRIMATFKAEDGVSLLSLCPYDLQLLHTSLRGDEVYLWDLLKLPQEVSFLGKFTRGKTSAVIEEVVWSINKLDNLMSGINSGFGCITKSTGTVHWYNTNYVLGHQGNNFPKTSASDSYDESIREKFMDSWILPSIKARKFFKLPKICNDSVITKDSFILDQLAIIDDKGHIKLLSPLNGSCSHYYELPQNPINKSAIPLFSPKHPSRNSVPVVNFLSQAEIESCTPYINMANNPNITFATYNHKDHGESDFKNLIDNYAKFGSEIPLCEINL